MIRLKKFMYACRKIAANLPCCEEKKGKICVHPHLAASINFLYLPLIYLTATFCNGIIVRQHKSCFSL